MKSDKTRNELMEEIHQLTGEVSHLKDLKRELSGLREELAEYKEMLQLIPEIIFRIDPDGNFVFINDSVKKLGYEPRELIGRHFSTIIHPEDSQNVSWKNMYPRFQGLKTNLDSTPKFFDERRTGERMTEGLQIRILKKPQSEDEKSDDIAEIIITETQADEMPQSGEKTFLGSVGTIKLKKERDDTSKKVAEYESLIEVISDIVFKIDPMGHFTYINDAVKNLGYEPGELIGRHFSTIIPPDIVDKVSRSMVLPHYTGRATKEEETPKLFDERRTGGRTTKRLEMPILKKQSFNRQRPEVKKDCIIADVSSSGFYDKEIFNNDKNFLGTVGIIKDISRHKLFEEELLEKNRELDDFVYMVSHQLKSPFEIIRKYLLILSDRPDLFGKYFNKIYSQSKRLETLLDKITKLHRAGRITNCRNINNLKTMIFESAEILKPVGVDFLLDIDFPFPDFYGDPDQIGEMFHQLLENSFQFRDPDKNVLKISIRIHKTRESVNFHISDNGLGIKDSLLEKIFEPGFFYNNPDGCGLGLAIVRRIVEAHHGIIWASSQGDRKGTLMRIELPAE